RKLLSRARALSAHGRFDLADQEPGLRPRPAPVRRAGPGADGHSEAARWYQGQTINRDCPSLRSDPLHHRRDALPDADAHRAQRIAAAGAVKLLDGGEDKAGAGHAERVTERDRSAIGVHARILVGQAE